MTFLTYIALSATLGALFLGIYTTLADAGYLFDLRKRARRTSKDGRSGGRRSEDASAA